MDEIWDIVWQTGVFLVRLCQFIIAVVVHKGVDHYILPLAIPHAWDKVRVWFELIFFGAFALMYAQQVFDMVTIIVPALRQRKPVTAESADAPSSD